jgi:pimeloyl-ACP methyl ester carboxylesterase
MTLALRQPQNISALIPVDNSPVDAVLKSDFGKYVHAMRVVEEAKVTKQSDADAILQKYEDAIPIRQFLLTNLTRSLETKVLKFRIPIKTLASSLNHMADFPFRDPDEARYEGPTLFVRGTKSHYVADEALPLIGRFFPSFELLDIESGHWVISEKPEEFRQGVVEFLQRKSAI